MSGETVVRVERVSKSYRVQKSQRTILRVLRSVFTGDSFHTRYPVLEDVTFEIRRGERVALLGRNGSGKSTLLRLIAGILNQTSGSIEVDRDVSAVFTGETGLMHDLSVTDNIDLFGAIHGIPRETTDRKRGEILELAGLSDRTLAEVRELSSGERRRLAMSIFFQCGQEFILLDEALSHVDASFGKVCEGRFAEWSRQGRTLLVVSHDLPFVRRFCGRALWIDDKRLRMSGPVGDVADAYEKAQGPGLL